MARREVMLTNAIVLLSVCHNTSEPPNGINLIQNFVSNCIIIINITMLVMFSAQPGVALPPWLRHNKTVDKVDQDLQRATQLPS